MKEWSHCYKNATGNIKNHLTKYRHVCTLFNVFSIIILNMDTSFNNSVLFLFVCLNFLKNLSISIISLLERVKYNSSAYINHHLFNKITQWSHSQFPIDILRKKLRLYYQYHPQSNISQLVVPLPELQIEDEVAYHSQS